MLTSALVLMQAQGIRMSALEGVRRLMKRQGLDALVIPSDDPHLSEYVAPCFERRAFVSGFTGSAGTAVVTSEKALLWTDSRYWLQAESELSGEWELVKSGESGVPTVADFLKSAGKVGIDSFACSGSFATNLRSKGAEMLFLESNLVDEVWTDRPALPSKPLRVHPLKLAGESVASKLSRVREATTADALVVAALDEVCWLLNVRGGDVECNPVALAYAVVTRDETLLFCGCEVDDGVAAHLEGVKIAPYDEAIPYVRNTEGTVMMDPTRVTEGLVACVPESRRVLAESPIALMKATKNEAEIEGMRQAHLRDGAAVVRAFCDLETRVLQGKKVTEADVGDVLLASRSRDPLFLEPSFPTIAGSGPNGAIVHYRADPATAATVDATRLLLVDSGGQYVDGTTDATRTMHFGTPTPEEKEVFTRVLKGHIALDTAVFPDNRTPGFVLDGFARRSLWASGRDYGHGTGHGVGAALNVHEGPQSISPRYANTQVMRAGMIVSNEPGYYETGAFGVRIENLLVAQPVPDSPGFLEFSRLTHIPIDTTCVDLALLDDAELAWLNDYNAATFAALAPYLSEEKEYLDWLRAKTRPLRPSS
ncbi:hypothetical protein CTAYLR_008685 [Chrysophaeum taylorii]|uniref:Xaa-Pro aminopeptidase n=1 Tax=Chrysophaeum taylorii TaxID=2483200 RepID=A0AAD7XUF9_9STRA|nr:hypothetical protein CTAYLR_008685 [Chrysophaeum taylorii]